MSILDWLTGGSGSGGGSTVGGWDENILPGPNTSYAPSTAAQNASALSNLSNGGMNWAGLSSGLSNLSKSLGSGSGGSSGSDTLQTSPSVSSTVSGGQLSPAGGGGGAAALASMLSNRNQLAQYLMLSAMQGKGRGGGGKGLLG